MIEWCEQTLPGDQGLPDNRPDCVRLHTACSPQTGQRERERERERYMKVLQVIRHLKLIPRDSIRNPA